MSSPVSVMESSPSLDFPWRKRATRRALFGRADILEAIASRELPISLRRQVRIGIATGIVVEGRAQLGRRHDQSHVAATDDRGAWIVDHPRANAPVWLPGAFVYQDLGVKELKGVCGLPRIFSTRACSGAAKTRPLQEMVACHPGDAAHLPKTSA
jgi:hypothetical protein